MTPGDGTGAVPADRTPATPRPGDRRAETYLRLRAEVELRRALSLPRYEPYADDGLPGPLRQAARLTRPAASAIAGAAGPVLLLGRRGADVLRPVADHATRRLRPLADDAGRRLQPLTDHATRTVQPLADDATRRLRLLGGRAVRTMRPLADDATRRLQPFAARAGRTGLSLAGEAAGRLRPLTWQAAERLRELRYSRLYLLMRWRGRAASSAAVLRRARAGAAAEHQEPSADEGVRRLRTVADALAWAEAIDRGTADSILTGLEAALAARSRIDPHLLLYLRDLHEPGGQLGARPPAGSYVAAPVGVLVPAAPDSGLAELRVFTLVIAPDRAILNLAGRLSDPSLRSRHQDPWPLFGASQPTAIDDRGVSYALDEDSGWSDSEGDWGGMLRLSPIPPAGLRWLDLTMSPGSRPIRVDVADPGRDEGASGPVPAASPAERLIDTAAVDLLLTAVTDRHGLPGHDLSEIADIVAALDAVGALEAALGAVGRLATLAGQIGVSVPPALSAAAPPTGLPAAWTDVLENRDRRDGPRGWAPAAAVLPELDGARFVLAGLRSDEAGAELDVMAWGGRIAPHMFDDSGVRRWSWSARDDQGRWHVAEDGSSSSSEDHADLHMRLVPPLHPQATSLEVTVAGRSGQVTATVPLDWRGPR